MIRVADLDNLIAGGGGEAALVPPEPAQVCRVRDEGGQGWAGHLHPRPRPRLLDQREVGQQLVQAGVASLWLLWRVALNSVSDIKLLRIILGNCMCGKRLRFSLDFINILSTL